MSLFQATLATGFILIVLGLPLVVINAVSQRVAVSFLRSQKAAVITMLLGASWFLMRHVVNLSDADFGNYKGLITIISLAILLFSFLFLPDFLSVRGASILFLLFSREALDAAVFQQPETRLFMVSAVYLGIVAALYLSAWPYRLRDFFEWLFRKSGRARLMGAIMASYGVLLGILAYNY